MPASARTTQKLNWGREFSKYIKKLKKTPKYRGFSYPCLATQKNIVAEFKKKKERYIAAQKREEQLFRNKMLKFKRTQNSTHGGCGGKTRRKTMRGGAYVGGMDLNSWGHNVYNQAMGYPLVPSALPYVQNELK